MLPGEADKLDWESLGLVATEPAALGLDYASSSSSEEEEEDGEIA